MGLITGDLVLDLLDPVLAGLVVVDVGADSVSIPLVVFGFHLSERDNASRPIPRRIQWIRPRWNFFVAVDDALVARGDEIGLHDFSPLGVVVLALDGRAFGQS
jgi:hypothetical protein